MVHEKLKEYDCTLCEYSASHISNLKRHKKVVHDKDYSYKMVKDKQCGVCKYSTYANQSLSNYMILT